MGASRAAKGRPTQSDGMLSSSTRRVSPEARSRSWKVSLAFLPLDPQEPELGTAQRFGRDSLVAAGLRTIPQEPVDSGGAARGRREQRQVGGEADRIGHGEQAARVVVRQAAARQPLPRGLLDAAARDEPQRFRREFGEQATHAADMHALTARGRARCLALRTSPHAPCPLWRRLSCSIAQRASHDRHRTRAPGVFKPPRFLSDAARGAPRRQRMGRRAPPHFSCATAGLPTGLPRRGKHC
jgi:hypothetical protein